MATRFNLDRSQVLLNSSHTHNSPVLRDALLDVYPLHSEQREKIEAYSTWLEAEWWHHAPVIPDRPGSEQANATSISLPYLYIGSAGTR